jgi:hypothetical protein
MLQRQWWCWHLRQLQPAADIGARRKPVDKHGSEVHVQVSGDARDSGDPVQEFARFVTLGRRPQQKGVTDDQEELAESKGGSRMLPVMQPDAAGVDIGAEEIFVAVPADRAADSVRSFGTFTRELHELADWLQKCGVRTVAMESTGVFWIPLYQILETRGFGVFLVNAQHVKNVPGRKSDVSDCQWIQYLH